MKYIWNFLKRRIFSIEVIVVLVPIALASVGIIAWSVCVWVPLGTGITLLLLLANTNY